MGEYFAFQWHVTEACDQRCKHCYLFAEHADKPMKRDQMVLTLANIEDFCRTHDRLPCLHITGDNPILHPDFWRLPGLVKEKGIPFTILGNPFHPDDKVCKWLADCGCDKYQLSIDGMEKTHDRFRMPGLQGDLGKTATIKKAGITSVLMAIVSSVNGEELPEIIDTVVKYKADVFAFARYVPTSSAKSTGITPSNTGTCLPCATRNSNSTRKIRIA